MLRVFIVIFGLIWCMSVILLSQDKTPIIIIVPTPTPCVEMWPTPIMPSGSYFPTKSPEFLHCTWPSLDKTPFIN